MFDNEQKTRAQQNQNGWYAPGPRQAPGQNYPGGGRVGGVPAQHQAQPQDKGHAYIVRTTQGQVIAQPVQIQPDSPQQERVRPPRRISKGLVAVLLILSLVGGAVGGSAATLWHLNNIQPQPPQTIVEYRPVVNPPTPQPPSPSVPSAFDVTYAVEKAAASVVEIDVSTRVRSFFGEHEAQGAGSGVILNSQGYIATNYHVIDQGGDIIVRIYDGREYPARLVGTDPQTDLAVVKIEAENLVPTVFSDPDAVRVGQIAVAIGNPLGALGGTVTHGVVSAMNREITIQGQTMTLMQTSAAVNPGNSGGGLFNAGGELIGVVNAKGSGMDIEGLGFAIPSDIVQRVTDDIIRIGYVTGRPELGIRVIEIDNPQAAAYHGLDGNGVFVVEVTRDNGLMPGDQILYINGAQITMTSQVAQAVRDGGVGAVLQMIIMRDGQQLEIWPVIGEQIPESVRANLPEPSDA